MDFQTLTLLYRYSREFSHDRLRGMELTDTEYMICSCIYARPGCSQDEVSAIIGVDGLVWAQPVADVLSLVIVIFMLSEKSKKTDFSQKTEPKEEKVY